MTTDDRRQRVIARCESRAEFETEIDGLVYWWPSGRGSLSAAELRVIADELDRRNADEVARMDAYAELTGGRKRVDLDAVVEMVRHQ